MTNFLSNIDIDLLQGSGDPNGTVSAKLGSLYVDLTDGQWWRETSGPIGSDWIPLGGSNSVTYTNTTPVPSPGLGGVEAGSTFSAFTMQQMWDLLLYPYQYPAFSSFTSTLFSNYEVGESLPSGYQTIYYGIDNFSNVDSPYEGGPTSSVTGSTFPVNPVTMTASGDSFQIVIPTGFYLTGPGSRTVSLEGTNTQAGNFTGTGTMYWYNKRYWGQHPSFSAPSDGQILSANGAGVGAGQEFSTTRVQNRDGIDGGGNYLFFAWPTSFGAPTFIINGLPNNTWTKIRGNSPFVNASGYSVNYDVWISNTPQYSPITSFQII